MSTDSTPSPPRAGSLIASSNGGFTLSAGELAAIHHEMGHYEDPRAASIEALATVLGISAADIEGVATFYNMIFRQPVGRHVIKVCDSIACFLTGQEALKQAIVAHTGIGYGATTTDERFTLLPVCCLGNCDKGPTLMIDDDTHGPVAPEQVPALLERYR